MYPVPQGAVLAAALLSVVLVRLYWHLNSLNLRAAAKQELPYPLFLVALLMIYVYAGAYHYRLNGTFCGQN